MHIIGGMHKSVKRAAPFRYSGVFWRAGGKKIHFLVASKGGDAYYRASDQAFFSDSAPALSGLLLWQEPGGNGGSGA